MGDTGNETGVPEDDGVPRIAVRGFKRSSSLWAVYSLFNKFGTVTYVTISDHFAVVEFESRDAVDRILPLKHLRHDVSNIKVERLLSFPHAEPVQLEFCLDEEIPAAFESVDRFEKYVDALSVTARSQSNTERDLAVCKVLEDALRSQYPECKAHMFGSRVSQTGLPDCDLDIFLDAGGMYDGERDQDSRCQEQLVNTTCKTLSKSEDFKHITAVPKARVPILHFLHLPTNTRCDVAFRHGLGVENTKLLVYLLSLDRRLHPLCMFVKKWAHLQDFRAAQKRGHFSSYALVLMMVFYLQQLPLPVLPPVLLLLAKYRGPRHFIAGWDCSFTTDSSKVPRTSNTKTVLELLEGFCKFYRTFDFDRYVICPLLGSVVEKVKFNGSLLDLHPGMHRYVDHVSNGLVPKLVTKCAVCVQDPLELSHNLTQGVKLEHLMRLISSCGLTHSLCAKLH